MTAEEYKEKLDAIVDPVEEVVNMTREKAKASTAMQSRLENQEQVLLDACATEVSQLIAQFTQDLVATE